MHMMLMQPNFELLYACLMQLYNTPAKVCILPTWSIKLMHMSFPADASEYAYS